MAIVTVTAQSERLSPSVPGQGISFIPVKIFLYTVGDVHPRLHRSELTDRNGTVRFRLGHGDYMLKAGRTGELESTFHIDLPGYLGPSISRESEEELNFLVTVDPESLQCIKIEHVGTKTAGTTIFID